MSRDPVYWQTQWVGAMENMPWYLVRTKDGHDIKQGQKTLVRILLGYKHTDPQGRNCAAQHFDSAAIRGSKPKDPQKAKLLQMLAGPYGTTLVRAIAIQRGIDLKRYKKWP